MSALIKRISTAFNKGWFCCKVANSPGGLWKLMTNTKKLARHSGELTNLTADPAVEYQFRLRGHSRSICLRTYAGDLTIFYDIWWRKIYDLPDTVVHSTSTIIDLGAHVGMTSLYFSLQFPQATIYAVEADAHNYELLCKNLAPEIENGRLTPCSPLFMRAIRLFTFKNPSFLTIPRFLRCPPLMLYPDLPSTS